MSTNKCSTMTIKNEMIKKMYGSFEKAAMHVKDVECWSARIVKMPSERDNNYNIVSTNKEKEVYLHSI